MESEVRFAHLGIWLQHKKWDHTALWALHRKTIKKYTRANKAARRVFYPERTSQNARQWESLACVSRVSQPLSPIRSLLVNKRESAPPPFYHIWRPSAAHAEKARNPACVLSSLLLGTHLERWPCIYIVLPRALFSLCLSAAFCVPARPPEFLSLFILRLLDSCYGAQQKQFAAATGWYQETSRACCEIESRAITPDDGHDKFAPSKKRREQTSCPCTEKYWDAWEFVPPDFPLCRGFAAKHANSFCYVEFFLFKNNIFVCVYFVYTCFRFSSKFQSYCPLCAVEIRRIYELFPRDQKISLTLKYLFLCMSQYIFDL